MKENIKWIAAVILILAGLGATMEKGGLYSSLFLMFSGALCVPPVFVYIEKKLNRQFLTWQKYTLVILGLFLGRVFDPNRPQTTYKSELSSQHVDGKVIYTYNSSTPNPSLSQKQYDYKVIGREGRGLYIVLKESDLSESNVKAALEQIRRDFCGGECNINAYDAIEYYNLYRKWEKEEDVVMDKIYANMNASKESKDSKWQYEEKRLQQKYYIKVADHFVGAYDDDGFEYYPFRSEPEYEDNGGKR